MGDKSEDQRGSQTLAPPRHQTAPLSSLPCFQLQSGREMVRIMTLSIRETFISSTLSHSASLECDRYHWGLMDWQKDDRLKGCAEVFECNENLFGLQRGAALALFPLFVAGCGLRDLKPSVLLHFFPRKNPVENLYTTHAGQTTIPITAVLGNAYSNIVTKKN